MKQKIIITTNEQYIWRLIDKARQGNTVRVLGWGDSMRPLLESGRDYIDLAAVGDDTLLKKYDVVFYQSHENKYVLHRIYSISEAGYYLNGDGNLRIEPVLNRDRIYLKAVGFVRKGKYLPVESYRYKCYVHLWTKLLPFRAFMLRWYQRLYKLFSVL